MLKDSSHEHERILTNSGFLKAKGRELYLFIQGDGNLCLYPNKERTNCIWASGTHNKGRAPHILVMQEDGNLVIYDADKKPTWATDTYGKGRDCTFYV